jgi:nitronate monooxygenase
MHQKWTKRARMLELLKRLRSIGRAVELGGEERTRMRAGMNPISEVPIIQAPMAGGPSTPELTAAVARAGGFGFLAAGYLSPDQLVELIRSTRALSSAPFGVNIFCPSTPADLELVRRYAQVIQPEADRLNVPLGEPHWEDDGFDQKIEIVRSERVNLVSFTFGCPSSHAIDDLHRADCQVAVTVTSRQEAHFAEDAGADFVLVQGTEAGGHQGSFLNLLPSVIPLSSLLAEIRESIRVPMIGSGGIMTGADAAAVLNQGAIGVQLGTAFLCCPEAGTSATYRRALLHKTYPDTVLTRAFSGRYARGLANEFAVNYADVAPDAYPEVHHLTRPIRNAAAKAGDPSIPNLWAGQGWKGVTEQSAQAIVRRIATDLASAS